ncbi:hypothetical protein EBN03_22740 [Nocardia stercoris]|uniref:Uncharacterized protein n=1 Tax=Nocardia stercoris TaxID=2483361 RepID=A0A3M2L2K8_9NOCA|nr:hypothetical protein EBN03_22740 [Nocardia stercoris]
MPIPLGNPDIRAARRPCIRLRRALLGALKCVVPVAFTHRFRSIGPAVGAGIADIGGKVTDDSRNT